MDAFACKVPVVTAGDLPIKIKIQEVDNANKKILTSSTDYNCSLFPKI
jgi:hypothetical protein